MKSFFLLSLLLASSVGQLQILPPILGDGSFSLFDNLLSDLVIQNNGRHNIFANGTLTGILSLTIGSATSIPTIIVTPNSVLSVVGDLVINNGGIVLESGASLIANNIKITADNTQIVINEASNVVASILSVGQGVHATFSGAGSISVNSSVVIEAGASLNYDVDVSFAAGTIFDVAADGVQQFLGDVKNIAANDLNIAGNVILQAGSSVSGVKNVIFDGIVDIQSTVDKAVEFTTGVVFQKATTIEGLVNSVSSVAFQEAATLGSSAIAQLKNVIASANFTLQSGASLVIQELETTVKAVYFDVASNANVLLTSGLSTIRSDLVSVGQGTFQIVDATVAAAFSDVNLLFSSNVQLGGTVNLGVDANGVAKVITQFSGVVHALNETVLNALAQFNAGSIITGSSNIGSAAAITFNAATLLSSSASVNGAISIQTKVMFAADATVDGTVQLANSATLGAQAWLLLRTKAVINGDTNANIFLNSGAILYASSDASVNLASGLSLSKNVTVQAAASATLTIGSNVNILASGTADARFIGAIVVSGDIKAAASSQIILSGTSTVVSSVNADLQTAAKLTMDATVNASAHIVASGQVSFGGSLEIRLCAQVNAQVNAQANGNVVIADYLARAGVFASLDVNLVAGCSDDAPSGVASKRDASGYSVHYTDKQAYASADNVNNNNSDVSSAQRVAFVGMMTLMLALFA